MGTYMYMYVMYMYVLQITRMFCIKFSMVDAVIRSNNYKLLVPPIAA